MQDLTPPGIKRLKQLSPGIVAKCRRPCCRTRDIHKQHGCEHPLWLVSMACACQKLFDLIKNRILITKPSHMIVAWKLD
jgi:hypothetical protein